MKPAGRPRAEALMSVALLLVGCALVLRWVVPFLAGSGAPVAPASWIDVGILVTTGTIAAVGVVAIRRRREDEALRESEERFRGLSENSLAGTYIFQAGVFTYVNPAMARIVGCSREEMIGANPLDIIHPEDRARAADNLRQRLAGELGSVPLEYRAVRKDGQVLHISLLGQRMDVGGRPAVVGHVVDVTGRRRAQEALRSSEERHRQIVETIHDGLWMIDPGRRTTFLNHRTAEILGYEPGEMIGMPLSAFLFDEGLEDADRRLHRLQDGTPETYERRYRRKNGEEVWTLLSTAPVRAADGSYAGSLAVVTDITERRRNEEEIRRLNAELEDRVAFRTAELAASMKEMEAFSYSVSHDLRAPVRAIDGFTARLDRGYGDRLDDEGRRLLAIVRKSAHRMGALIDDLLRFSRLSRTEMRWEPLEMTRLARKALSEVTTAETRERTLVTVADLPPSFGDPALVHLVLANLLSNALKFSGRRKVPVVAVGSRDGAEGVEYFVRDNGAGFDPRYVDKLFGVFQRLHSPAEFEGTGIGLALVKRIVERHGGRVWAESEVDRGATFWFTLPGKVPAAATVPPAR